MQYQRVGYRRPVFIAPLKANGRSGAVSSFGCSYPYKRYMEGGRLGGWGLGG